MREMIFLQIDDVSGWIKLGFVIGIIILGVTLLKIIRGLMRRHLP